MSLALEQKLIKDIKTISSELNKLEQSTKETFFYR